MDEYKPLFPRGEIYQSPHFSGKVWLNPLIPKNELNSPTSNVTFAPGCRNNWHRHPGGQILLVTDGQGWYQEEGKTARSLLPGDVVEIPAQVKHWHGAAEDTWFAHLSITPNPQLGAVEWLEPVDDAAYDSL